jgi:hypothetical protein
MISTYQNTYQGITSPPAVKHYVEFPSSDLQEYLRLWREELEDKDSALRSDGTIRVKTCGDWRILDVQQAMFRTEVCR